MGGENCVSTPLTFRLNGSSPRGRGKPCVRRRRTLPHGLIPAWAGKTACTADGNPGGWAHPRVGGENCDVVSRYRISVGSSPRGRGKPPARSCTGVIPRLIPAWAGKTCDAPTPDARAGAHPRVGGENRASRAPPSPWWGSSPRGRGKPASHRSSTSRLGLIPAWAGKTCAVLVLGVPEGAHPRVGGENAGARLDGFGLAGSSPRGRGKPLGASGPMPSFRLIPAWAGKTPS